jgi:CopG family transcriptional regulator/antitoxin EndoAI
MPAGLLEELDVCARQSGRNRSEVVREAMRSYLSQHARSDLREKLKHGYIEMASINLELARECAAAEDEAFAVSERFLAGGD